LQLSPDLKAHLPEIYLLRENQGGKGGKRLEGPEIGIGSIPKRREWERILNKRQYAHFEIENKWRKISCEGLGRQNGFI
jgi:hypothetical protein